MLLKSYVIALFVYAVYSQDVNEKACNNGLGKCVPYFLCVNGIINTDGEGLLDIRTISAEKNRKRKRDDIRDNESECDDYFENCCAIPFVLKRTNPIYVPMPPLGPIDQDRRKCGFRNNDGLGFRITGNSDGESRYGEFPWMMAILKKKLHAEQVVNVYQCGGSLIHPSVVLTAAHCVQGKKPQDLKVRAGEWDTQRLDELYPQSDHDVDDLVVNKDFKKENLNNDIALLFLKSPVKFEQHIDTVCLPPQDAVFDHSRCTASGWGKDTMEGKYQVILKKVELPIVPISPCQESLRKTRLGEWFNLHDSFLCAGGEPGKDTCIGDGGSPLVCPVNGRDGHYYQAGIVSWGIGCGEAGTPGVYVNVAKFRNWIDQEVQARSYNAGSYSI